HRLLACGAVRFVCDLRPFARWNDGEAVAVAEQHADGLVTDAVLEEVRGRVLDDYVERKNPAGRVPSETPVYLWAGAASIFLCSRRAYPSAFGTLDEAHRASSLGGPGAVWLASLPPEARPLDGVPLLREVFGNPFSPPPSRHFPPHVVGLAQ